VDRDGLRDFLDVFLGTGFREPDAVPRTVRGFACFRFPGFLPGLRGFLVFMLAQVWTSFCVQYGFMSEWERLGVDVTLCAKPSLF
jgi:hypothetical protein